MKILKLSIKGLQNLKNTLDVDFVAQQRVDNDAREQMFNVFSNVYTSPTLSFIGINASGKTTILKLISFAIGLLNNEPINSISSKKFLDDLDSKQNMIFTAYFYHNGIVYKLETIVGRKRNAIDGNTKFVIIDETLWEKEIHKIKTKKRLYDFNDAQVKIRRNKNEQYLIEDVSIIVALNKEQDTNFSLYDMSDFTDHNMLNFLGQYPKEILTFLDPSIETLSCEPTEKKVDIRLKFYEKEELTLNSPLALNRYLSSGTIKGLSVFMGAVFSFLEGGYLIVDELENHFNKEIVSTLIRFFMDKKVNKS